MTPPADDEETFADRVAPRPRQPEPPEGVRERRFAAISGRPEPAAQPGRLNVGKLLRRCAGTSEELLAWVPVERPRYTHMGGFVLFTALMAIGSSTIALAIAFDRPWYQVFPAAVFWGVVIFNLDRWITASSLPEHGWRRFAAFAPRLLMAVVFAVVIAEPVLLIVFKTAVTEQLGQIRAAEDDAYQSLVEDCNPAGSAAPAPVRSAEDCKDVLVRRSDAVQTARTTRDQAQKTADASDRQLTSANRRLTDATEEMTRECRGQDGSRYGDGPVCERLSGVYRTALRDVGRVSADNATKHDGVTAADQALAQAERTADANRAREIQQKIDRNRQDRDDEGGLLERIEALNAVAVDHLSLLLAIWAVRLLLIAVDSIPAIAKLSSGTTVYDRLVREEGRLSEDRHRARSTVDREETLHWVDESAEHAEVGRAERRGERDRAADALLLSAALHRDQQADRFRPVVGDDRAPFARATHTMAARVEPAGPADRPQFVATSMKQGPIEGTPDGGAGPAAPGDRADRAGPRGSSKALNVVALGGPGSGKTTFLAQMYAVLRRSHPDHPFTLTLSDGAARTRLENWAETIRTPGDTWPDSTTTTHLERYEFVCDVDQGGVRRPVQRIDYWDYSGEALLQNTALPGIDRLRHELSQQIAQADALLVVVDGEELRAAWDGDGDAMARLVHVLTKIEAYAEQTRCPAQIVVTKWDELENRRHPQGGVWNRAKVVRALTTLEPIRSMSHGRTYRAGSTYGARGMRIIPVSVVGGAGSTQRGPDRPYRRREATPVNVDVPFVGLLPDRLGQLYAGLGSAELERRLRQARRRRRWAVVRHSSTVASWLLGAIPGLGAVAGVALKVAETALSSWFPSLLADKMGLTPQRTKEDRRLLTQAAGLRATASAADRARYRVMEAFSRRLIRFDDEYPPTEPQLSPGGSAVR